MFTISFVRKAALSATALICLSTISNAQSTFAFQGLYAGNSGAFTSIDGNNGPTNSSNPFTASHSFTGQDSHGNQQTMTVSGSAWSNASYGKIHINGQGTVSNPYYNSNNSPYFDGNFDPNGSPDLLAINGNAGFTDVFTYTGLNGAGYKVNFYFRLEGTVSGDIEAGLNFSTSDPAGLSFNPRTYVGNELWITPYYQVDWNQPLSISADFYAGLNTHVSEHAEGISYSASADYGNTLELAGMVIVDASGAEVTGWTMTSASGTTYPSGAVPEPSSVIGVALGLGYLVRRRKNSRL
jgi:PEP-CTERM motif